MLKKNLHLCFTRIHCLPTWHPLTLEDKEEEEEEIMKQFSSSSEPEFSKVVATHSRFFVSSPGTSNSILHSSSTKPLPPILEGVVPVRKYSPNPYMDFRESMEEMIRARRDHPTAENQSLLDDWEYLHQLLLCYLSLNPKRIHKFIIGAFTDLVLSSA